jgi:Ca-activated chloride channel family protein
MTGMAFLRPGFAWALPAALLLLLLWHLFRRRRFVASTTVRWLDPVLARPSPLRRLPAAAVAAALGLVSVALMEPVLPLAEVEVRSQGLDIALVLDLSSSMQEVMGRRRPARTLADLTFTDRDRLTMDTAGRTRLETTKQALRDFIASRRDDRIGLVVFSDHPYVVSPLTLDYDALLHYVALVDDQILRGEGMTAIGDGLAAANDLLARQGGGAGRRKVAVVFTDGEYNVGRDPVDVLADSSAAGYRVHLVGVDLEEEIKDKPAVRRLIQTVRRYGGQYYDADTERELRAASAAIDALEKGPLTSKAYVRQAPVFHWFALPAAALIVAGLALRSLPYFANFT